MNIIRLVSILGLALLLAACPSFHDSNRGAGSNQRSNEVEVAGQIVFPNGNNPFPGGHFPDLRIRCRNQDVDSVERAPFVNDDGKFNTVFQRGQTYDFYWMGFIGGKEKFATVSIEANGPPQQKLKVPYTPNNGN